MAEASVVFAGMCRMAAARFALLAALSNLGISAVYAAIGAWATDVQSFLLAFLSVIAIPVMVMLLVNNLGKRRARPA